MENQISRNGKSSYRGIGAMPQMKKIEWMCPHITVNPQTAHIATCWETCISIEMIYSHVALCWPMLDERREPRHHIKVFILLA